VWADPCVACEGRGDALEARDVTLIVPPGVRDGSRVRARVGRRLGPLTHLVLLVSVR
jgi:DnaJ-class molecular chaperone